MGLILLGLCQDTRTISHQDLDRAQERGHTDKHKPDSLLLGSPRKYMVTCLAALGDTDMSNTLRAGVSPPMPDTLGTLLLAPTTTPMLDTELDRVYLGTQSVLLRLCRFFLFYS